MKYIAILLLLPLSFIFVHAQYVEVMDKSMSGGTFTSFSVFIEGKDEKAVQKGWDDFMNSFSGKTKFQRKTNESTTTGLEISGLGSMVTCYSQTQSVGSNSMLSAWFESNGLMILDSDESKVEVIENIMEEFILFMKRDQITEELNEQEKYLEDLEKQLIQAEKEEEKAHKTIAKCEAEIAEARIAIENSKVDQEFFIQKITEQQVNMDHIRIRRDTVGLEDDVNSYIRELERKRQD